VSWSLDREGSTGVLRFSHPPDNWVTLSDLQGLQDCLKALAADDSVNLVILAGDTEDRFIGHWDRTEVVALRAGRLDRAEFDQWRQAPLAIEDIPQPVVAAMAGPARGGGSELALACTFRVGTPSASFCQHEVTREAMPGGGATQRLPRLVGPSRAARILMTGETVDARAAREIGLLDAIVEPGDVVEQTLRWAAPITQQSRASLASIKRALLHAVRLPIGGALAREQELFLDLVAGKDI